VEATIEQFMEWKSFLNFQHNAKKSKLDDSCKMNPFNQYDLDQNWAYADYKYMIELFNNKDSKLDPNVISTIVYSSFRKTFLKSFLIKCIDWSPFGFVNRNAQDSTLWIGTPGAFTPCHYDSYGYNLVAQIYGKYAAFFYVC
jgi:HSPB1-associated protein 1